METFTAIDSASLGGRVKRKPVTAHPYSEFVGAISLEKQKKVIAFLEDYEKIFSLLARVLKPGKLLVLTLGNRRVDNKEIAFDVFNDMLNVAVSRAVHSLAVITSQDPRNDQTNYGDLARYIEYNNFEVIQSQVYSVFDMLYQGYAEQRRAYLQNISEYRSTIPRISCTL